MPPGDVLQRQSWLDALPLHNPCSGVQEGDRLPLSRPETEFPAIGRWFQGRPPARRENEVAHVSNPHVLRYRVSQVLAGHLSLLQHVRNGTEKALTVRRTGPAG